MPGPLASRLLGSGAYWRARRWISLRLVDPRTSLILLGLVCVLGVGARAFHLGIPGQAAPGQGYVFDERYYVSAARVIAGDAVAFGDVYAGTAPAGADPNGEHPQLGKVLIAGGITLFGDNPIGWRAVAVLFGAVAVLLLYWLVRCAGGSPWVALGAAALGSVESLWVVSSRIAVLDIFVVPFMLAAAAFYLRRQPIVAGALIGIGSCIKEFCAYAVLVLVLLELLRGVRGLVAARRSTPDVDSSAPAQPRSTHNRLARAVRAPVALAIVAGASYLTLLAALDRVVTPYSNGHRVDRGQAVICNYLLLWEGACNHVAFMNSYAGKLRDIHGAHDIASPPVDFWVNRKAITYYKSTRRAVSHGVTKSTKTILWFRGEINWVLLATSWFALALNLFWAVRRRDDLSFLVLAWALGTWLPAELFNLVDNRTTYLYYMVVTMPALYIAVARLLALRAWPRLLIGIWIALLLYESGRLYPFRTLSGT